MTSLLIVYVNVFPTCVGMNRWKHPFPTVNGSVPHMRGDEPAQMVGYIVA